MKLLILSSLLLALTLCHAHVIPVAAPVPALIPATGISHQFVPRNYNGFFVPTTTAWPGLSPYPNTFYKYSGGYPTYTYPYGYSYSYYPSYNYGYGYKSIL
ncbi:hypothetical protein ACLKA7_016766 [Drosophila subpalustris]